MAYTSYDEIAKQIDFASEKFDSTPTFENLPQGYYLAEVTNAEIKTKEEYDQISITFTVVEDGRTDEINDRGIDVWKDIPHTTNRKIWKHYPIKDAAALRRFVTDMLKFEGATRGEPLLEAEYFTTKETLPDALDILRGRRIYIQADHRLNQQGQDTCWYNIIGWNRAVVLGLEEK